MENVKTSIVFQTIIINYINMKMKYPLKTENMSNSYYFFYQINVSIQYYYPIIFQK